MWNKIYTSVKYSLLSVNFLFLITGIVVLSVGIGVHTSYNEYHKMLPQRFFSLPAFCIATGAIIFIIVFCGFYGAYSENYYFIMGFAGSMVVIFIFQLSACIAGYALKGQTVSLVQTKLQNSMAMYGVDKDYDITKVWDEVQQDFTCCGVLNASDWLQHLNTFETEGLPLSCCEHKFGTVATMTCNVTLAYSDSCASAFGHWMKSHVATIAVSGVFLVLAQALAVGGAFWMVKIYRAEHSFP